MIGSANLYFNSFEETDPYNARSQLISKFAEEFAGQDFMIGGFSKDGELGAPVEFIDQDGSVGLKSNTAGENFPPNSPKIF